MGLCAVGVVWEAGVRVASEIVSSLRALLWGGRPPQRSRKSYTQ